MNVRILIAAFLACSLVFVSQSQSKQPNAKNSRAKKLLLIGQGPDGHQRNTHEYNAGMRILAKLLEDVEGVEITVVRADGAWSEGPSLIDKSDGVVMFLNQGARWMQQDPKRYEAFTRLAARGGGLVALHWAVGSKEAKYIDGQIKLLGGTRGGPKRKHTILETQLKPADPKHPIVRGIESFRVRDEFYYRLNFVEPAGSIQPMLQGKIDGNSETICWCWERPDKGRSFGFTGLHFHDNWRLTEYRRLVTQGVLWTLKLPIPEKGQQVEISLEELKVKDADRTTQGKKS